jgi:protein-tyrosine-phosphatase
MFDSFFHAARRRKARRELAVTRIRSVLFVCNGNIFRSPYAAAALRRSLASRMSPPIKIDSAGFIASGRSIPEEAIEVAWRRGVDLSSHISKVVTRGIVDGVDLVAVMSPDQLHAIRSRYRRRPVTMLVLGDLDPFAIRSRTIVDPLGSDVGCLDDVYSRIERCVDQLAGLIAYTTASYERSAQA